MLGSCLDSESGRMKVTKHLLVEGHETVYAIGDICNVKEEKMAAHAETHADYVVQNIQRSLLGQDLLAYKPSIVP